MSDPGDVTTFELDTNRSPEALRVQRVAGLPGVEFWTIASAVRIPPMIHDTYAAVFVRTSTGEPLGRQWIRGGVRELRGNALVLVGPGEGYWTSQLARPVDACITFWNGGAIARTASELGIPGKLGWTRVEIDPGELHGTAGDLWQRLDENGPVSSAHDAFARALVALAGGTAGAPGHVHPGVQRARELLDERFHETVSLDQLGEAARGSKFHLLRRFRDHTGFAPHRYQKLRRLGFARRLIESGTSVEEAATKSGFADGPHLSRSFRQWLGVAPGAFGRAYRASTPPGGPEPVTIPPPRPVVFERETA